MLWYVALLPGMTNRGFQAGATTGVSSTLVGSDERKHAVKPGVKH
jgi:hypothetical protein